MKGILVQLIDEAVKIDNDFSRMYDTIANFEYHHNTENIYQTLGCTANKLFDCLNKAEVFKPSKIPDDYLFGIAHLMELAGNCGGLKTEKPTSDFYFRGTRKNATEPIYGCQEMIPKVIDKYFGKWGIVSGISILISFILFLNMAGGYCLCCHPDREDNQMKFAGPGYRSLP